MSNKLMDAQNNIEKLKSELTGKRFKHFKGNIFTVIDIGIYSETAEPLVIYKNTDGQDLTWCRPLTEFLSEVDHVKYPDVKQKMRFELID